jgi:hypothetical protein
MRPYPRDWLATLRASELAAYSEFQLDRRVAFGFSR